MRRYGMALGLMVVGLLLVACGGKGETPPVALAASATVAPVATAPVAQGGYGQPALTYGGYWVEGVPQRDDQGAISVEIRPLNLNNPAETLDFAVALNTHSVDLSMDLQTMAVLRTDTGLEVAASAWEAPRGGHHVRGVLSFPSMVDGRWVVDESTHRLTILIRGLDGVPERVFTWERP